MYLYSNMEKIKKRKKELGWSNQKLSKEAKVPVGTINKIFSGATRYPRQETLDAIVEALGLSYYDIEDFGSGVSIIREASNYMKVEDTRATLDTYYALPEDTRAELIDGEIYYMSAPSANHQIMLVELSYLLRDYLRKNKSKCRLFVAPFDVQLDCDNFTMVQPDLMIICDKSKYEEGKHCYGAPDFVVEIVSKSNPRHDYFRKLQKYSNAGVKEYWIVDPEKERVLVYHFEAEVLPAIYTFQHTVASTLYPDFTVDFSKIKEQLL